MDLGVLLLKKSGRQGSLKFIITLIAAALGTLIILGVFSITNAANRMGDRAGWHNALANNGQNTQRQLTAEELRAPNAVISVQSNEMTTFLDKTITVYNLHFTGGTLPNKSPLAAYPKAGEYYASPALAELLVKYPNDVLRDRFTGKQIGLIPAAALASPDELVIIRGVDAGKFQDPRSYEAMNAMRVTDFGVSAFGAQYQKQQEIIVTSIMGIGALGLIIPVTMLITTATRLGAREREMRYAALRLIGATKQQIRKITFVDSLAASLAGIALGGVLFLLMRPLLFNARVAGNRFFPEDITISPLLFVGTIVVIVGMVWAASAIAMRGVITSPLGVARKQKLARVPRVWSLLPLLAVLGAFWYLSTFTRATASKQFGDMFPLIILGLFVLMIFCLLFAGGWLTKMYGRLIGLTSKIATGLLVSRRVSYDARRLFRGIGGIVVAFYAGAFFMTVLATITKLNDMRLPVIMKVAPENSLLIMGDRPPKETPLQQAIEKQGGYQSDPVAIYYDAQDRFVISCLDAQRLFQQNCTDSTQYVTFSAISSGTTIDTNKTIDTLPTPPDGGPLMAEYVYLPKTATSVQPLDAEKIITAMHGDPSMYSTILNATMRDAMMGAIVQTFKSLLYVGIVLTIFVASLNLVVATVSGLFDRKGSFFTLRLSGAELPFLQRVVTRESMLPLVFISLVAISCGFLVAFVFLRTTSNQLNKAFVLPEPLFWACVVAAFVLSYAGIRAILPMLGRLTDIESNRSE